MLDFLFARLTSGATPDGERGAAAFAAAVALARRREFFRDGGVPDTIDGRFAVLATVLALLLNRLESEAKTGDALSVAVTERFIAAMESEHRELGLGDPTLGKTVRKLVGALANRVDLWRTAVAREGNWTAATRASIYGRDPEPQALELVATRLRVLWSGFAAVDVPAIARGDVG